MADRIITVTNPSIVTNDTLAGYNNYSDIDGQLGTMMTPTEATSGHTVVLSDGEVHEVTTKPVGTISGEFSAVVSNAVTVDLSAATWVDGVFDLDPAYLVKAGTNYICQATGATTSGGFGTTALLVGDFRVRCELEVYGGSSGPDANNKSIIGAQTTQTRSLVADGGYNIYANGEASLDVRVNGATVTVGNPTAPVYAAGNYMIVERVGTTFRFIQDVGGVETVVHTDTGPDTPMYIWIYSGIVGNWIQKPEYKLL